MAIRLRQNANLGLDGPIDVYGLCEQLRVPFRFVDVSMEGMYQRTPTPYIILSALRPLARRVFNCAHELGHHAFGHGFTIDGLVQEHLASVRAGARPAPTRFQKPPEEFLVDAFAGFLLMPTLALRKAYTVRGLRPETATPAEHFGVACHFGVGYTTLINHLTFGSKRLSSPCTEQLLRVPLAKIRSAIIGDLASVGRLIVADEHWQLPTVDAEVGTHLLLPPGSQYRGDHLVHVADTSAGRVFLASRPGISRVHVPNESWAAFVRVSRFQYVGLGRYRHLDDLSDVSVADTDAASTRAIAAQQDAIAGQPAQGGRHG